MRFLLEYFNYLILTSVSVLIFVLVYFGLRRTKLLKSHRFDKVLKRLVIISLVILFVFIAIAIGYRFTNKIEVKNYVKTLNDQIVNRPHLINNDTILTIGDLKIFLLKKTKVIKSDIDRNTTLYYFNLDSCNLPINFSVIHKLPDKEVNLNIFINEMIKALVTESPHKYEFSNSKDDLRNFSQYIIKDYIRTDKNKDKHFGTMVFTKYNHEFYLITFINNIIDDNRFHEMKKTILSSMKFE